MGHPCSLIGDDRLRPRQNTLSVERPDARRTPDDDPRESGTPHGVPAGEEGPLPIE